MSTAHLESIPYRLVTVIPPKRPTGRTRGVYSGLSARIRALKVGEGMELDTPNKAGERSLRSLVASIGKTTGCELSVRLSDDRSHIGVYRLV